MTSQSQRQLARRIRQVAAALKATNATLRTIETALEVQRPERDRDLATCLRVNGSDAIKRQADELEAVARHLADNDGYECMADMCDVR